MIALHLGDARAEQDYAKNKKAFYESPDYKTLIESDTKSVVVGRRGVGKSALFFRLNDYFDDKDRIEVIRFAPDEHEIVAFRSVGKLFNDEFRLVRAATRIGFRYALMMEIVERLSSNFKFKQSPGAAALTLELDEWKKKSHLLSRLKALIVKAVDGIDDPEARVGELADSLDLNSVEKNLSSCLEAMKRKVLILVDRLDEGYELDEVGVGIVDGFIHAGIELKDRLPSCRTIIFLRDNIYRAVEHRDQDFSRNIEQSVLRLHWDERALLTFVANRIRTASDIKAEQATRVWDSVTQGGLQGESGFHSCLRLTLFRPRDLLLLLNESFRIAANNERFAIQPSDIEVSAKAISDGRLTDLKKEYSVQLPGLSDLINVFRSKKPVFLLANAEQLVGDVLEREEFDSATQQQFELYFDPKDALSSLYSVGFLGVREVGAHNFVFCHDGRKPEKDFSSAGSLMIHPCYWMALHLEKLDIADADASEIYDEYDVTVTSETPEARARALGRLEADLREIEIEADDNAEFEKWCLKSLRVLFSGGLRNLELYQRNTDETRSIIGTNNGNTRVWKSILDSSGSKSIVFRVFNTVDVTKEDVTKFGASLSGDEGSFGFLITRDDDLNLRKDADLPWVREVMTQQGRFIVKLTAKFLVTMLNKIRRPARHDAAEEALEKLLATYRNNYFDQSPKQRRKG